MRANLGGLAHVDHFFELAGSEKCTFRNRAISELFDEFCLVGDGNHHSRTAFADTLKDCKSVLEVSGVKNGQL